MGSTEAKLPGRELSRAVEDLQLRDRHCDEFVGTGPTQPPGHRANGEEKVAQQSPRLLFVEPLLSTCEDLLTRQQRKSSFLLESEDNQ